jgi:ATP-dependent DNA helicase RecQ
MFTFVLSYLKMKSDLSFILKKYWGFDSFRPLQEEIIASVLEGRNTLALLPTGGGKSICFQVPGMSLSGICLVVTPLIALMKDQVEQLRKRGIIANSIYSGMPRREIDIVLYNCVLGKVKFLYVSPERLKTDLFKARVAEMNVSIIAIDEAHCISQWGYDFRPAYLEIPEIYSLLKDVKKIALTATATKEVSEDILEKLEFEPSSIFQKSFARKNLSYSVFELENKEQKMVEILSKVKGSAIVYVRSRKETFRVSKLLDSLRISSDYYHAGLTVKERSKKQTAWTQNQTRVMVSTNAFGMGIDKPDVRAVIHFDLPDSLEAYYQEAGRAGRDERNAFAVLLYSEADIIRTRENFVRSFPSVENLKRVYQSLANYYKLAVGSSQWQSFDFKIDVFSKTYKLNAFDTFYSIKKLEENGLILLNESFFKPSVVMFSLNHEELYRYCIANRKMEPLIKGMLRLYGGEIYTEFVKVIESDLAQLIKSSVREIQKNLSFLHKNEILIYDPIKEKPQLTFLTPRVDSSKVIINKKDFDRRREIVNNKLERIIGYAKERKQCRTRIFQEYFNETSYLNCGVCDRCIQEKKRNSEQSDLEYIIKVVLNNSNENWISVEALKTRTDIKNDFLLTDAIRVLLDQNSIELSKEGQIRKV